MLCLSILDAVLALSHVPKLPCYRSCSFMCIALSQHHAAPTLSQVSRCSCSLMCLALSGSASRRSCALPCLSMTSRRSSVLCLFQATRDCATLYLNRDRSASSVLVHYFFFLSRTDSGSPQLGTKVLMPRVDYASLL